MGFQAHDPVQKSTPGGLLVHQHDLDLERPWQTVVWDDPVNLMSYVSYVFRTHFGFDQEQADSLMLQVHHRGSAVVAEGSREAMEMHVEAMHGYGLWATTRQADGS